VTALVFSLNGAPRGKGRPRTSVRGGFARIYTDAATRKYEASVRAAAEKVMGDRDPFEGPLSVSLRFRMPIPKSATKRVRTAMAAGEIAHTGRPDIDNCQKAILDALNGVVFADDGQVCRAFTSKLYAEIPGVDVRVEAHEPQGGAA